MFLETVESPGLSHFSYLIGAGEQAAVVDPRRDAEIYVTLARRHGARITHIFETHRNEDFLIGSPSLARWTGATIYHGAQLPWPYGTLVGDGELFNLGSVLLTVLSTPGHTDESISLVVTDREYGGAPIAVFTGDALFVGDVGRTDFYPDRRREVAGLLYDSIFHKLLPLGDEVVILPAHGAGSVCGKHLASRRFSTIGYERRYNPALQYDDRESFIEQQVDAFHYYPPYFSKMHRANLQGATLLERVPTPPPLPADQFAAAIDEGMLVVDVRSPEAFGGAHIPDALSLPLELIPVYAGWLVPYDRPLGLVVETPDQVDTAVRSLLRIGLDGVRGYLGEEMAAWETSGRRFASVPQISIHEVERWLREQKRFTLLDVRKKGEVEQGHLPGAIHRFLGDLPAHLDTIPAERPLVTFCSSGRRAMVAASLLLRHGGKEIHNCLGSMQACRAVGCPVEK